jgi:pyrroloquinoline quinone biosynthesis protein B
VSVAVVLGVAQDAGHPQAACRLPCCERARQDPTLGHLPCALGLVSKTGQRWLVDATPALPEQLARLAAVHPARTDAGLDGVLLTHAHMGHYTGLVHLGQEGAHLRGVPVWVMPRMRAFLEGSAPWEQLVRLGNITLRDLVADVPVRLAPDLTITPVPVPHRDEYSETVAFRITGPSRTVLWLPDIDSWDDWAIDLEDVLADHDIAWVDGSFFSSDELPGRDMSKIRHPRIADTLERIAGLPQALRARVRFVHLNHTNPVLDPASAQHLQVTRAGSRVAVEGTVEAL